MRDTHLYTIIVSSSSELHLMGWIELLGRAEVTHCHSWVRIWALHTKWASCWMLLECLGPNVCQIAHLGMAGALLGFQPLVLVSWQWVLQIQVGVMEQGSDTSLQTEGLLWSCCHARQCPGHSSACGNGQGLCLDRDTGTMARWLFLAWFLVPDSPAHTSPFLLGQTHLPPLLLWVFSQSGLGRKLRGTDWVVGFKPSPSASPPTQDPDTTSPL